MCRKRSEVIRYTQGRKTRDGMERGSWLWLKWGCWYDSRYREECAGSLLCSTIHSARVLCFDLHACVLDIMMKCLFQGEVVTQREGESSSCHGILLLITLRPKQRAACGNLPSEQKSADRGQVRSVNTEPVSQSFYVGELVNGSYVCSAVRIP